VLRGLWVVLPGKVIEHAQPGQALSLPLTVRGRVALALVQTGTGPSEVSPDNAPHQLGESEVMPDTLQTRRVAVVARGEQATALHELFQSAPLRAWEAFLAESCEHAHFLLQMDACDALLADQSILDADQTSLGWLTTYPEVPVLFVSEAEPDVIAAAL